VLWPMLLAASDDQGRGQAEADVIKWTVCPNVSELTIDAIPGVLAEMQQQGMVHVYEDKRGRKLYQVTRWWEYQQPQWARPSRFDPPTNWNDRVRFNVRGGEYTQENWDIQGGFQQPPPEIPAPELADIPQSSEGNIQVETQVERQSNLTESNSKESKTATPGADAPPDSPTPTTFEGWKALGKSSKNRPAVVHQMFVTLYPASDPPDYGYIGRVAKRVGGYGRLMDLLWQYSTRPPTGDVLAYVSQAAKGGGNGKRDRGGASIIGKPPVTDANDPRTPEQAAELERVAAEVNRRNRERERQLAAGKLQVPGVS